MNNWRPRVKTMLSPQGYRHRSQIASKTAWHACIRVEAGFESRSQLQGAATPNAYLITIVEVAALHRLTR